MMPVVAQTVAVLGERPSANAFGIARVGDGDLRLRQVGLHAQALDHRVQLRRLLPASRRGAPIAASASLSEANRFSAARPPAISDDRQRR